MSIEQTAPTFTDTDRSNLERYLQARGWEEVAVPNPLLKQWIRQDKRVGVQVPQAAELIDFGWLMELAVDQLARVEGRTAAQVLEAVRDLKSDILRVRLGGSAQLSLKQGVKAIDALPRLFQAAAEAELRSLALDPALLPHAVNAYMDTLKLKQTEVGSFVLRVASPLDVSESPAMLQGRRVIAQLVRSIAAVASAAEAAPSDPFSLLPGEPPREVSADLLDALATFGEACEEGMGFTVELEWAPALAAPEELPPRVTFESAWTSTLRAFAVAASRKQAKEGREVRLTAFVDALHREGWMNSEGTLASLWTLVDGTPYIVEVELSSLTGRALLFDSWAMRAPLYISGTLMQRDGAWVLRNAHSVAPWSERDGLTPGADR